MITFNVVYTPGTTVALLPLSLSLLRSSDARFVLVDNGCGDDESKHLSCVGEREARFAYYRLPFPETVHHGTALEHLLERCGEPTFAILDSDLAASGDFATELEAMVAGPGAASTGWPVWLENEEAVCRVGQRFLGGPYRLLADGTEVGGTSCTVYDRNALVAALRRVPHGLAKQTADALDPVALRAFRERGWLFDRFGTARAAHLQLVLQGDGLTNFESAHLHHVGGLSHVADLDRRRVAARLAQGPRAPLANLGANIARRVSSSGRERSHLYRRKRKVVAYIGTLMDALRLGQPLPSTIETGSVEVDARVRALARALSEDYPGYCERVRDLVRA